MGYDFVITGGTVVSSSSSFPADIAVAGGKIAAIRGGISAARSVDATGKLVLPGGVDPHCHIEQLSGMGQWNADTFETATRSAAMGGTTSVISFAAQQKGEPLADTLAGYAARAKRGAMVDHAFHLFLSDLSVPDFDADLLRLVADGHRSLKVFTTYNVALADAEILHVLSLARQAGATVCVHAENDALIQHTKSGLIAAGLHRPEHHALSRPRMAEIEAVERICRFAAFLDAPVMLFHISTREAVEVIRKARAAGVPIWAETCPHYLLMTDEVLKRDGIEGAKWMCCPPQRQEADQEALWEALSDGTIDLISSDHAPYRFDETGKLAAGPGARFDQIGVGLPGLETRLPVLFDAMRRRGLPHQDFVRWTSSRAAELYGLPGKGDIAPGLDADLVIWDPERARTYGANDLHDNVGYNPWEGREVIGWPERVFLRGEELVADGALRAKPGQGQWLDRPNSGMRPTGSPSYEIQTIQETDA
ncbi:D-hydantoinase [Candidatus Rhodobacter oscarellae]|uniref:D-hydantoinase n=1 Tax=Candidatus Rhodobacter oscarellae TaxID=1675527 RepID=A0A0J9E8I9_9RHOB|nr:dihydropyrimidinase [Candidatus Rhodobacter lobularis]KMW59080.1 D-hydantoinase [Candidatus Rhodobacter lobularis]